MCSCLFSCYEQFIYHSCLHLQFCYYLFALLKLVKQCAELDVYIDFACRVKRTWQRWTDILKAKGDAAAARAGKMNMYVNWMHGASHDMACQLQNSGRFQRGAGHVVGEQAEQLWSLLKVCSVTPAPFYSMLLS